MSDQPESVFEFRRHYPRVWEAFEALAGKCHEEGGPLEERARRLVKLGIAIGLRQEGAVHSATRRALECGCSPAELMHVAILAISTLGWPASHAAMCWIQDILAAGDDSPVAG